MAAEITPFALALAAISLKARVRVGDTTHRDALAERMVAVAERMIRDSPYSIAEMSPAQRCVHAALEASDNQIDSDTFWTELSAQLRAVIDGIRGNDAGVR